MRWPTAALYGIAFAQYRSRADNCCMSKWAWCIVGLIIAGQLVVDVLVTWLWFPGDAWKWLLASLMGICVAQINLIAIWAAMTPGRVILRVPWSIFLATLMWYALVLGNRMEISSQGLYPRHFRAEDALLLGLILFAAVLALQLPLWGASLLFGWRLVPPGHDGRASVQEHQFNIVHLIAGMLLASLALGLGRLVLPEGQWRLTGFDDELLVILPALGVVNLFVVMPCIWGAFARRSLLVPLAVGWSVYAIVVTVMEILFISLFLGVPPDDIWFHMGLFNIFQCLCVFGTLLCLRGIGFRLRQFDRFGQPQLTKATSEGMDLV
jgi:hypothetical protein